MNIDGSLSKDQGLVKCVTCTISLTPPVIKELSVTRRNPTIGKVNCVELGNQPKFISIPSR